MNPPSALQSAMGRERKPFTYTPGGLDLSEIKSQRMAQRLMRNAMNQGVAEVPTQPAHFSPTAHIAVPNFNCLPVQVFPTIQLPLNPKSLLRTRSHPSQSGQSTMPSFLNPKSNIVNSPPVENKPVFTYSNHQNVSRTQSLDYENNNPYEIKNPVKVDFSADSVNNIPSYDYRPDVDYFQPQKIEQSFSLKPEEDRKYLDTGLFTMYSNENYEPKIPDAFEKLSVMTPHVTSPPLIEERNINEQKDVRIVKKQATTSEKTIENGSHNGDTEAAVTVKLPTKASAAKTETKVEVVQKTLPDGSLQEIKTTTTRTTINGKTEIKTQTETTTTPKAEDVEEEEEVEESEEEVEESSIKKITQEVVEESKDADEVECTEEVVDIEDGQKKDNLIVNEERSETTTTTAKKVMIVESSCEKLNKEENEEIEEDEEVVESSEVIEDEEKLTDDKKELQGEEEVIIQEAKEEIVEMEQSELEENEEIINESNENEDTVKTPNEIESAKILEKEDKTENNNEPAVQSEHEDSEYTEEEYESEIDEIPQKEEKSSKEEPTKSDKDSHKSEKVVDDRKNNEETISSKEKEIKETEPETEPTSAEETQQVIEKQTISTEEKEVKTEVIDEGNPEEEDSKEQVIKVDQEEPVEKEIKQEEKEVKEIKVEVNVEKSEEKSLPSEHRIPIREPSVPLEKVEDVEIKPITGQDFVTKTHTEKTEIITSSNEQPTGTMSTQTEYNRVENIVTVNRLTKTLDKQFEDYVQPTTIPSLSSYFSQARDISPARQTPKPVQPTPYTHVPQQTFSQPQPPIYSTEPVTERRHSLLLERLSVERQLPITEVYQNQYNTHISDEQRQWSEEPRSEVLIVGNVKPSAITKNQQWYQYSQKENVTNNNVAPTTPVTPSSQWNPPQHQYQKQYQPKPQTPRPPQLQSQTQTQPIVPPIIKSDPSYKSSYTENIVQDNSRTTSNIYKSNVQQNTYSSYAPPKPDYSPKPDAWSSNVPIVNQSSNYTNQFSSNTDYYTAQPYPSSYVPPPWEQDSRYVTETTSQTQYQPPQASTFSPTYNQSWQPAEKPKFTKPPPTAYIPPAPNQSFVVPVTSTPPKVSGRKTYYSEYERRYISVPESNYVPTETKYQHQPDPSPVYYYNNEEPPSEPAEPEWRKELREFTEKSKTETYTEYTSSIKPPWVSESVKPPQSTYTPTPTWSQTLRPRSFRESSYEAEFAGSQTQEWPKSNTMGRSRPLSSYEKNDYEIPAQRVRGVSVDRFNPNSYQSPIPGEHPPVLSQTLTPQNAPHKNHPHVPAYNSRASAEPRDQPASYKQPQMGDSRAPFQSRSFKYLQWITGTED